MAISDLEWLAHIATSNRGWLQIKPAYMVNLDIIFSNYNIEERHCFKMYEVFTSDL